MQPENKFAMCTLSQRIICRRHMGAIVVKKLYPSLSAVRFSSANEDRHTLESCPMDGSHNGVPILAEEQYI